MNIDLTRPPEEELLAFLQGDIDITQEPTVEPETTSEVDVEIEEPKTTEDVVPLSQVEDTVNTMLQNLSQQKEAETQLMQEATEAAQQQLIQTFPDAEANMADYQSYIAEVGTDPSNLASWREAYFAKKSTEAIPEKEKEKIKADAVKELYKQIQNKQPPIISGKGGNKITAQEKPKSFKEAAALLDSISQRRR
jgi:hypothetical protein